MIRSAGHPAGLWLQRIAPCRADPSPRLLMNRKEVERPMQKLRRIRVESASPAAWVVKRFANPSAISALPSRIKTRPRFAYLRDGQQRNGTSIDRKRYPSEHLGSVPPSGNAIPKCGTPVRIDPAIIDRELTAIADCNRTRTSAAGRQQV